MILELMKHFFFLLVAAIMGLARNKSVVEVAMLLCSQVSWLVIPLCGMYMYMHMNVL